MNDNLNTDNRIEQQFVEAYPLLLNFCKQQTQADPNNYEAAHDLAHDTVARAWQNIDQFQGKSKLSTWLCKIARNLQIDHARVDRRRNKTSHCSLDDWDESSIIDRRRPTSHEQEMKRATLANMIMQMPSPYRQLIIMYWMGYSFRAMSLILGIPEGTAKTRFYRGLQALIDRIPKA